MAKKGREILRSYIIDRYFANLKSGLPLKITNEYRKWSSKRIAKELEELAELISYRKNLEKIAFPSTHVLKEKEKVNRMIARRAGKVWDLLSDEAKEFILSL